jgi:hypothetical protein
LLAQPHLLLPLPLLQMLLHRCHLLLLLLLLLGCCRLLLLRLHRRSQLALQQLLLGHPDLQLQPITGSDLLQQLQMVVCQKGLQHGEVQMR